MKNRLILFVLFLFKTAFSQSISFWNDSTFYNTGDIVFFKNVRYIATMDSINKYLYIGLCDEDSISVIPGEDDGFHWQRLVPLRVPIGTNNLRMLNIGHHRMDNLLTDYDGFVMGVMDMYDFFDNMVAVGGSKDIFSKYDKIHGCWSGFMVDKLKWDVVKSDMRKWIENGQPENDREVLYYKLCSIVSREYNKFERMGFSKKRAYEQIIHNIGDAGVAFSHALDDYTGTSEDKDDRRERANEYAAKKALNEDNWGSMSNIYFTGSIYDAIAEYGIRTLKALKWAKENIGRDGSCNTRARNYACYIRYSSRFDKLAKDENYGVTKFSIAVGRFILIDAILAELPLEHQKINGEPFIKQSKSKYTFTAYARDPDAVWILHKDSTKNTITTNSKLLINLPEKGYQLWHDLSAHDMFYYWDITGNGTYHDYYSRNNGDITFNVVSVSDWDIVEAGGDGTIDLQIEGGGKLTVNIKEGCFNVSVKIKDDEGDSALVTKQITLRNSIPVAKANLKKGMSEKPYVAKVIHKNTSFNDDQWHENNGISVLSGFSDLSCYENLYIDFFSESIDSGGTASDIIIGTKLKSNNDFNLYIRGVNQDTTIKTEQRLIINNTFWLETAGNYEVKAKLKQYFVSSIWENDSSPKIDSMLCKTFDSTGNYQIEAEIINNGGNTSLKEMLNIPVLAPPIIKTSGISILHNISKTPGNIYEGDIPVLNGGDSSDMVLELYAEAYDHNNKSSKNLLYVWEIRKKGESFSDSAFTNSDLIIDVDGEDAEKVFSCTELFDLNIGLKDGETYEVFLMVKDYYGGIIGKNYGFTITKAGEFKFDNPNYLTE
ncbi:MAG: hypothetical protein LBH98_06715 [Chitinispirillales bacterium]|jgi:hypothetical protein|nr:hypothetical protein [Chitinispirillales bacterium]